MKHLITALSVFFINLSLYGQSWYTTFLDAVYGQNVSVNAAERLFQEADRQARESLTGSALLTMLSRCEYLLGRVYQDHNRKDDLGKSETKELLP